MAVPARHDVIAGYYGFGNFGDDLFREILWTALSRSPWARPAISQAHVGAPDGKLETSIYPVFAPRSETRAA